AAIDPIAAHSEAYAPLCSQTSRIARSRSSAGYLLVPFVPFMAPSSHSLEPPLFPGRFTVQQYRRRGPARPPNQSWRTFLRNHRPHIWAVDLLTVQTLAFRTLYVLVLVSHARRGLVHVNVTATPTAAWVWRQLIEATPWGRTPRY